MNRFFGIGFGVMKKVFRTTYKAYLYNHKGLRLQEQQAWHPPSLRSRPLSQGLYQYFPQEKISFKRATNWDTVPVSHLKWSGKNDIDLSVKKMKIWFKTNAGKAPEMGRKSTKIKSLRKLTRDGRTGKWTDWQMDWGLFRRMDSRTNGQTDGPTISCRYA